MTLKISHEKLRVIRNTLLIKRDSIKAVFDTYLPTGVDNAWIACNKTLVYLLKKQVYDCFINTTSK